MGIIWPFWVILGTLGSNCPKFPKITLKHTKVSNKVHTGKIKKINVCTLETQMSKYKGDFKSKGNPKVRIKTPLRTKFKKSSFLENTVQRIQNFQKTKATEK